MKIRFDPNLDFQKQAIDLALQKLSLGDTTIKDVAEHYAQMGNDVEILTGDQGLKAYEPVKPVQVPRRRQSR